MNDSPVAPTSCKSREIRKVRAATAPERTDPRVARLYQSEGGPLFGWLLDERVRRKHTMSEMAKELGMSYPYLYLLRTGARPIAHISPELANSCASYLGVPPIVIKMLAGAVPLSDFVSPQQSDEAVINRALDFMLGDPVARCLLPPNVESLPLDARRALVLLYSESSRRDVLGVARLPALLRSLQRAALIHDKNLSRARRTPATAPQDSIPHEA